MFLKLNANVPPKGFRKFKNRREILKFQFQKSNPRQSSYWLKFLHADACIPFQHKACVPWFILLVLDEN